MKITPIKFSQNQQYISKKCINLKDVNSQNIDSLPSYYYPVNFGNVSKLAKAKQYLNSQINLSDLVDMNLNKLDLNKLDGIQEGIKVFEGLNMKEIKFFLNSVMEFAVSRGCANGCVHCYADAVPKTLHAKNNFLSNMDWDDFKSLTEGVKELKTRLGFNPIEKHKPYLAPFHDADSLDFVIKDNKGNEHDFIDVANELYDAFELPLVFDTSGWFKGHTTLQKRAEKFVKHYLDPNNRQNIIQFNISFNPFHALNAKAVEFKKAGDIEKANKFRDLYTSRMANAMFTFTPMHRTNRLGIIKRAFSSEDTRFEGFKKLDLDALFSETTEKLKDLYIRDFEGEQKIIKNKKQIADNIHKFKKIYQKSAGGVFQETDRARRYFNLDKVKSKEVDNKWLGHIKQAKNANDLCEGKYYGILDANGDYHITSYMVTVPTDIKLNFKNSGKKTMPIKPNFYEDARITRELINKD